jgi:hypothetical protein
MATEKAEIVAPPEATGLWRLCWVEADLRDPAWIDQLGEEQVDAVTDDAPESPIAALHEAALHAAGFREVGLIWRQPDDGVLLAVR